MSQKLLSALFAIKFKKKINNLGQRIINNIFIPNAFRKNFMTKKNTITNCYTLAIVITLLIEKRLKKYMKGFI